VCQAIQSLVMGQLAERSEDLLLAMMPEHCDEMRGANLEIEWKRMVIQD
jgi:hypothetical protein